MMICYMESFMVAYMVSIIIIISILIKFSSLSNELINCINKLY